MDADSIADTQLVAQLALREQSVGLSNMDSKQARQLGSATGRAYSHGHHSTVRKGRQESRAQAHLDNAAVESTLVLPTLLLQESFTNLLMDWTRAPEQTSANKLRSLI